MMNEAAAYTRLKNNLSSLGLAGIETNLDHYLKKIDKHELSVTAALCQLTDVEMKMKEERAVHGCVKVANFPFLKTLTEFDFTFQPSISKEEIYGYASLRFMENNENIIFIGSPGVGKTHMSVSIGIEAAKNRKSTYFINCNDMLMQLKKAQVENRLEQRLKFYSRYKLLIIDEVGFLPLDKEASKLFFQLISRRYEKRSTIITTNIELSKWGEIFGDPIMASAILDRLLHHSNVIRIVGKSYRTKNFMEEFDNE